MSREGIVEGGWRNALTRFFVPYYAASQDRKVSEFFIQFFKDSFDQDPSVFDKAKITAMLSLAEQHIAHGKGWFSSQTSDTCRLEHYTLIARERLNAFEPHRSKEVLTEKCRADNQALAQKWEKLGFSKDAFWSCPDLVDLVFRSHLHRYINHPYYKHSIAMRPILTRIGGQVKVELHPHLFVEGRLTPWSELRTKLHVDAEERLYSIENGTKKLWMYLDQGLTQWDKNNFDNPRRLKQLDRAPLSSRVEIITTHAHPEDWHLGDRLLKGVHHSYFRIVPRQGFATSHPNAGLNDGSVYSLGWMARWRDFSFLGPLSTLQGKWFCPDSYEFLKEDLCITPVDITDEQLLKLVDIVKRRSKEEYPYHIITSNCVGVTADLLKEAGILDLKTKNHVMDMLYKFIFPKAARVPLNKVGTFLYSVTPNLLMIAVQRLANFLYSVVFVPIFSILGAWRTTISYEDEDGYRPDKSRIRVKTENRVKALYSNLFDMFSPNKLEFDLSKDIYKWQKTRADSYFEKHD
ncbi:MAG: hypothetical protein JSS60_04255 [Verrucomicrobia bacterium]|nr:hypothetical protein [Verrucomicrobiota bacterium]